MGPNHNDLKCFKVQLERFKIRAEQEQQQQLQLDLVEQPASNEAQASSK